MYSNKKKVLISTSCILTLLVSNLILFTSGQSACAAEVKTVVQEKSQYSGYEGKFIATSLPNASEGNIGITMVYPTTDFKGFKVGEDAKTTFRVTNNKQEKQKATLIMGLYDNSERFINYASVSREINAGTSVELTGLMKVLPNGYKVKCFVWDSLENMNPLTNSIEIAVIDDKINNVTSVSLNKTTVVLV